MNPRDAYERLFWELVRIYETKLPGFRVAYKLDSTLARVVAVLKFPLDPLYMVATTSTWGRIVRFPSIGYIRSDPRYACEVLAHEFVHAWDKSHGGWWRYFLPQGIALLASLALVGFWWKPAVGALLFLAGVLPFHAAWRARFEARGYYASLAFQFWTQGQVPARMRSWIADQLSGKAHFWAASREWAEAEVETMIHRLETGEALEPPDAEPLRILRMVLSAKTEQPRPEVLRR